MDGIRKAMTNSSGLPFIKQRSEQRDYQLQSSSATQLIIFGSEDSTFEVPKHRGMQDGDISETAVDHLKCNKRTEQHPERRVTVPWNN
jgi:hypothetical protein